MKGTVSYVGKELKLFAAAIHWKKYLRTMIRPHIGNSVLEVGAGDGVNTALFLEEAKQVTRWVLLEPDFALAAEAKLRGMTLYGGGAVEVMAAGLEGLPKGETFDSILYIDVLEHIENDKAELAGAVERLNPGGKLIVLSPGHQFLFSLFDQGLGHFRRYNRTSLRAVVPMGVTEISMRYLDSLGFFAALANKLILKQSLPTAGQIHFWDCILVSGSRITDFFTAHLLGKSLLGVWKKE